jgi:AsmA protein
MKILLKIIALLALFILIGAVGIVYYVRNADYRSTIEEAVADATGYEITIAGDLDVEFFPTLGITLNDVRLSNPGQRQELMSTSAVILRVNFRELFNERIVVEELLASDFHVNYYITADGSSIWQSDKLGAMVSQDSADSGAASDFSELVIDRISINNTSIDYQDLSSGSRYQVANFNLESRDTNINGRPFDIQLDFDFENDGMSEPVPMSLRSNVIVDLNQGNLNFNNLAFTVTPLLLQGEVSVINLNNNPQFTGNLAADSFSLPGLLQRLGMLEESRSGAPTLTNEQLAAFQMQFSGNNSEATMPSLTLRLGEAEVEASGSARFATSTAPMNISYSVIGGNIDLSPYINADADEETEADAGPETAEPAQTDTQLPTDLLSSMNLIGSVSLASITVNDMRFDNINLYTNIEDNVLDLELTPVSAFDGSLQGSVRLDARSDEPALSTRFSTESLNLLQLAPSVSRFNTVTGNLNMEAEHSGRGSSVNALLDTLSGSTTFTVTDNSVDIGLIKQVFTAIAALSPDGSSIQQWPDIIRFNELGGYITLDEGLQVNQNIKLRMDNFDITGSGGIDLAAGNFDYDLLFTVLGDPFTQTIPIGELYHDISWPVQCSAAFDDPVGQYCGPDFNAVREIFTQIGTNAVRSRLEEVISDQVPEEVQDSARGLLRNLFDR